VCSDNSEHCEELLISNSEAAQELGQVSTMARKKSIFLFVKPYLPHATLDYGFIGNHYVSGPAQIQDYDTQPITL